MNQLMQPPRLWLVLREAVAAIVVIAVGAYVVTIVNGTIKPDQKLGIADVAVIVVGIGAATVIALPQLAGSIQSINIGDLKLELREIKYHQQVQKEEIDRIRLALELAATDAERKHLMNLDSPRPNVTYRGDQNLKIELRHLRSLELIRSKQYIGSIPDGRDFDLREFVELTQRGKDYLKSVTEA
jgi:hypothetical protein